MLEVPLRVRSLELFRSVLGEAGFGRLARVADAVRSRLEGRTVWNVNSTPVGGGVAEMLRTLLPYARGAGVDVRWVVLEGPPDFFRVTKRLHHALHGASGDGSPLDEEARSVYEKTIRDNATELLGLVRPGDVVLLHDPQPAGLAPALLKMGALVVWRCHIGRDVRNEEVEKGWAFLQPYLRDVPAFVFSRRTYVPPFLQPSRVAIVRPSIDVFSPKNQELDEATVRAILVHVGLVEGPPGDGKPVFVGEDGAPRRVDRCADVVRLGRAPEWEAPLVVQVSRWDPLKDPVGVMRGFADLVSQDESRRVHLLLAGPNVHAVADDPEGAKVFDEVLTAWRALPHSVRQRVHLANLPMADVEENAAIVNAIQRHAAVVVQKSLEEGFGLTVTEAMWKARPVVASAVGGIQDQIVHGVHGLLLRDPRDLASFGKALATLLDDPAYARRLGENARERVRKKFLGIQQLVKYAALILRLDRARRSWEGGRE
ncbi:MAG: glycosyl transferase family 1 [Candidatus Binatia bacterium]|nr:MAG: glycosyl transferase family 1 [Candidatus Binatia bacterium]